MLKIFYISSLDLGLPDAANHHTFEIATRLTKRGHLITLFIPKNKRPRPETPPGMQIIQSPVFGSSTTSTFSLTFYLFLPLTVWLHFLRTKPDIVYTRFSFFDFLTIFPLRLFFHFLYIPEVNGVPSIESRSGSYKRRIIHSMELLTLKLCDQAIGVTPELCQWIIDMSGLSPKKVTIIGNGVDIQLFSPMERREACQMLGLDPQVVYLNYTSSLKPWHGAQVIIRALPEIINNVNQTIQLLVVGDGPEKPYLQSLADQYEVTHSIKWVGRVQRNLVPRYINASTICLSTAASGDRTKIGLSPLKIYEYMSCAKPIVTTRIGGAYDEMIASGPYGILVDKDDSSSLAKGVIDLLENPEKAQVIGERNRQAAVHLFSWDHIAELTEDFLLEGMKSRSNL